MAKTLGELNNKWALLFKFHLVLFPVISALLVGWLGWLSISVIDIGRNQIGIMSNMYDKGVLENRLTTLENKVEQLSGG